MELSFESITLAASFLTCAYLTFYAFTPPVPDSKNKWEKDSLMRHQGPRSRAIFMAVILTLWSYHTLLILIPPSTPSLLCPYPTHLNPKYFTWNTYTVFFISLIFITAPIRLLAYKQLGQNFTFTLAKPKALVKTGMYKYVRHPSYPTLLACHAGMGALLLRCGGVAGCWMPGWLAGWRIFGLWAMVALELVMVFALGVRVREEEEMLSSAFGEEWEEYARKTKRFIPFVI
jgi:protein-S-isoprenylcysteine O-methyltransferase Ste14